MAGKGMDKGQPSDNLFISGFPEGFDEASLRTIMGAYGNITQCKVMASQPGRNAAAMVRFSTVDEAKWIVDNLSGNIPQGLTDPVDCKFAMSQEQKHASMAKGMEKGKGYGDGPYGGGGKGGGKPGKCSVKTLVKGLQEAGALPGGGQTVNDENTLFVAGLPYDTTDTDLYKIFAPFGPIKKATAMLDRDTGMCKGTGFVNMMEPNGTNMATQTLNGTMLPDGTWLTVKVKQEGGGKGGGKW
jgi:RNA recognition motif-containing protein